MGGWRMGGDWGNAELPEHAGHVNSVPAHWVKNMDGYAPLCTTSSLWERTSIAKIEHIMDSI